MIFLLPLKDYCGAKAVGFEAVHLDRSKNSKVTKYQEWLKAPEYEGKSEVEIQKNTINDFYQIMKLFES